MKHVLQENLNSELKYIEEGEVFGLHAQREKQSLFVLTPSGIPEEYWAIAVKIKGRVYESDWHPESVLQQYARKAVAQVRYIKEYGWYATGEEMYGLDGLPEPKYRCAYCDAETTNARKRCSCLRK